MSLVIDASVALSWCFADEASPLAERVLDRVAAEDAVVPSIWPFEMANGLRSAERGGPLDMADVSRIRELLLALPIRVESVDLADALGEVTELARSLQLTAYDAAYVALAARLGLPLATADQRLIAACSVAGVSVVE